MAKTEIGRKFERSEREPSLYKGETLAILHMSGKISQETLKLKIEVSGYFEEEATHPIKANRRQSTKTRENRILRDWRNGKKV